MIVGRLIIWIWGAFVRVQPLLRGGITAGLLKLQVDSLVSFSLLT